MVMNIKIIKNGFPLTKGQVAPVAMSTLIGLFFPNLSFAQSTFRSSRDVVFIDNVGTQRRLRVNDDETDVIGQGTERNGRRGQWELVDAGNGYYFIENVRNGARLQAVSNAVNNEESIRLSNGGFGSWVQWELVPAGNNFLLQNRAHNTNLNVNNNLEISAGPSRLNGPGVQWKLTEVDDGSTSQASATEGQEGEEDTPVTNNPNANVFSLGGLREAVRSGNNQTIIMQPGNYNITELSRNDRTFVINGNNNVIDLTGVHIDIPVNATEEEHFLFLGSGNTLRNGTIENTYPNGEVEITDFVSYNEDRDNLANGNDVHIRLTGSDNSVIGTKIIVRGSFPFGYGSYFGIGRNHVFRLVKRGGIQIGGPNALIDDVEVYLHAFGHAIYMQDDADNTIIRNCLVEGLVRETNDILAEGRGSLPDQANYRDEEGTPIPANEVESLAEDGIRSYGRTGSVTVDNCVVRGMRGGIRLYLASNATVSNTTAVDNGTANWNLPNNATVTNSSGNFTYAPLNDHRLGRSRQNIDMTILPSPNAIGSHNIADILGNDHEIVFRRVPGPEDTAEQRVIVVSGDGSTIRNETEYTIVLESGANDNRIISAGDVIDNGRDNDVSRIPLDL